MTDLLEEIAEEATDPGCPMCNGSGVLLGVLGSRAHFRCRDCGIGFSVHLTEED
jgi:transposase-like protein